MTDWEHVGDHALAGCHCRGQHLDRFFVSAALNHPLGCRQVLQDGIADLESLGLAACGFLEETALFLYRHRAKLTRFDLVRGPTEQHAEQQQPGSTHDPSGGVDVPDAVHQFDDREQGESDRSAYQAPAQAERHGQEGDWK
ncbi:MAG TPA: hypothetical protein VFC03_15390 [Acidimicrobiales bacterium]|nr:hypothetical protein [Acidimicrobiales bacterium]